MASICLNHPATAMWHLVSTLFACLHYLTPLAFKIIEGSDVPFKLEFQIQFEISREYN